MKKSHIPVRLNAMFFVIVCLFGLLVFRLVDLQVASQAAFNQILTQTSAIQVKKDSARGQIYDKNGVLLAGNISHTTIDYTRNTLNTADMIKTARLLASLIDLDASNLRERDLQDYFVITQTDEINNRLSAEEKQQTGTTLYATQLSKVTAEDIGRFSPEEREVIAIFTRMNSIPSLGTISIKNRQVSPQEVANITDHLTELSSVTIGSDWERVYPQGDLLKPLLGSISTEASGIPADNLKTYLAQGYANNSRIGTSYLEQQYDSVLRGTAQVTSYVLDKNSTVVSSERLYEGKAGDNLILSLDTELQKKVENILTNFMQSPIETRGDNYSVYAIVQDAKTGGILAISGKKYGYNSETNQYTDTIEDDLLGVINNNYGMGSSIKAATVGIGYKYGVITEDNNVIEDRPLILQGSEIIASSFNPDSTIEINDIMALARSSNIYMSRIALTIGGQANLQNGDPLRISGNTISLLRKEYAKYGLGGYTGIDLPISSAGFSPLNAPLSSAIFLSFGQYDTYSTLQVSQYMTTVANDGVRYAPRLVNEIRSVNNVNFLGPLQTDMSTKLLNQVDISKSQFARIKEGLYQVTHHYLGTEYENYANYFPSVSGKTGTTEAVYSGPLKRDRKDYVVNSVFTGYAPSNNPEVTVTVVVPYLKEGIPNYAGILSKQIFQAYFNN